MQTGETENEPPPKIELRSHVVDVCLHPLQSLGAAAEIDGAVSIFEYAAHGNRDIVRLTNHTDSCRTVTFSADGKYLFTGSLDQSISIVDCASGQVMAQMNNSHSAGISCMCILDEVMAASGDDEGWVKLWDLRTQSPVKSFKESEDYISDMLWEPDSSMLLTTSGDGLLSVFDIAGKKMDTVSDYMDEELLSLTVIKGGKKVVCGTQEGVLDIFTWGIWADVADRVPGHPNSVETIIKLDEDTVLTGSSDGLIRVMQIYPNKLLGVIGDHDEFPIEKIAMSHDRALVASCSHDNTVQFWDIQFLTNDKDDDDEPESQSKGMKEADEDSSSDEGPPTTASQNLAQPSFFEDL